MQHFLEKHTSLINIWRALLYVSITVLTGLSSAHAQLTPLSCGTNTLRHDWDTNTWPAGSLSQNYTTSGETLAVAITGDTGYFLPDTTSAPVTANYDTGGLSPSELSLELWVDFDTLTESVFVTFNIGDAGVGVEELQFSIFDVDFASAQFQDKVTISGSLNGTPVSPILSASSSNSVSGNVATGQVETPETSSNANLGVTFSSPVDQFTIEYTNGALAPDPPGGQAISIHDIFTCPRLLPEISAGKTITTHDPLGEGLYNIPGNEVVYTLTASNSGDAPADADSIFLKDSLPTEVVFFNGDFNGTDPGTEPVIFTKSATLSLTFDPSTDLKFSNSSSAPASFSDCNYVAASGYDPQIKHVCFNPKGVFDFGDPAPNFSLQFRTLIK